MRARVGSAAGVPLREPPPYKMAQEQAIHPVQPAQVEFENALDRLVYVQTISIRNYCDKARRVRIEIVCT